jgi:hypothetical protein
MSDKTSEADIDDLLAEAGISPDTTLADLKAMAARRKFGEMLVENTLTHGRLAMFRYIELPPEGWMPAQDPDPDAEGDLMETSDATEEQLFRAIAFQLWKMRPAVERVAMLFALLNKAEVKAA